MNKYIYTILLLILGINIYAQQSDGCKVSLPALSGSYTGECKKGLAHGKGIAKGIDQYEGQFYKGLPEGSGKYKWANGSWYEGDWKKGMMEGKGKYVSGDTVVTGFWKANLYQGNVKKVPYKITAERNIQRWTITKSVESVNGLTLKLLLGGIENSEVEDFTIASTSGTEYRNVGTYGIQNSSVPYEVTVRYRTWNQLHTTQYDVFFEVLIIDPGTWNITLINM